MNCRFAPIDIRLEFPKKEYKDKYNMKVDNNYQGYLGEEAMASFLYLNRGGHVAISKNKTSPIDITLCDGPIHVLDIHIKTKPCTERNGVNYQGLNTESLVYMARADRNSIIVFFDTSDLTVRSAYRDRLIELLKRGAYKTMYGGGREITSFNVDDLTYDGTFDIINYENYMMPYIWHTKDSNIEGIISQNRRLEAPGLTEYIMGYRAMAINRFKHKCHDLTKMWTTSWNEA